MLKKPGVSPLKNPPLFILEQIAATAFLFDPCATKVLVLTSYILKSLPTFLSS
tara:strand:- start:57 stop:215 length:159 start_codon:yes stop_codon:yes gene_type:complete